MLDLWSNSLGSSGVYKDASSVVDKVDGASVFDERDSGVVRECNVLTICKDGVDDQYFAAAATLFLDLANRDALSSAESNLMRSFERLLCNSIERMQEANISATREIAVGTNRGRLTAKDLMTEVERVLSRASGSLSLLERL